ncbi:MAG: tetratricopeptide repeat protein [Steroidobacteraceae bacterium]
MLTFILIAAALTIAAVAAIAVPLLRRSDASAQARWTALAVAAVLGVGASALYLSLSNWSWSKAAAAENSPQAMVGHLARRLMDNPKDLDGWLMLGRAYTALNETNLAARAYERANQLAEGKNADALIGLAQALVVQDESQLNGRAGKLIEQALLLAPHSPQVLFFGAAAAEHRGDLPLARQRFTALLALDPPDTVKPIIEQQISAIDQRLAGGSSPAGSSTGGDSSATGAGTLSAAGPPAAAVSAADSTRAAGQGPVIHIRVALSPKLHLSGKAGAPLFVFVRDPKQTGPPLAVKRLQTRFPQRVDLSTADAMIPGGRGIAQGESVEIVARIARSGGAIAKKGDPFGQTAYRVGRDGVVDVVIDQLTP